MTTQLKKRNTAIQPARLSSLAKSAAPRWVRLDHLPGFMWAAIRAMGSSVFSPLTRTSLEGIEVIADLNGYGPNSRADIGAMSQQLRSTSSPSNVVEYSAVEIAKLFGGRMYQARAVQFETTELTYLLVDDAMGAYIYRWPCADTLRRAPALGFSSAGMLACK